MLSGIDLEECLLVFCATPDWASALIYAVHTETRWAESLWLIRYLKHGSSDRVQGRPTTLWLVWRRISMSSDQEIGAIFVVKSSLVSKSSSRPANLSFCLSVSIAIESPR